MSNTRERTIKIIAEYTGVEVEKIDDQSSFIDDLGCDSLDLIEVTMACEEEFDIEIRDDEIEKIDTVLSALSLIESKLSPVA